ncbi:MAG: tetratricopeptide repeat protein [Gammaproteobacteria bacterium]|nr:tetratricopeptide repeat protein [Gammaproteobacteria bacterium]
MPQIQIKKILLTLILILTVSKADAQDVKKNINWDKIDAQLFSDLKQRTGKDDAENYQAIGAVHFKYENWDKAEMYYKKALELNPKLYWSWYNLALLYLDTEEGVGYLKKTIEANPTYAPAYYWLAYSYCRDRKDEEAIPIFKKYLGVAKDDPNESGRYEYAQDVLRELLVGLEGENLSKTRRPE